MRYGKAGRGLGASNAQSINRAGTFRHPVYGTGAWVDQSTGGQGCFDKTYMNEAPEIRRDLEQAMETIVDEIVRKAR